MSTKITEHDLDPNMDMAKQSTSEEILEKIEAASEKENIFKITSGQFSVLAGDTGKTVTLLDINGRGSLGYVAFRQANAFATNHIPYHTLKITADGVVKLHLKNTATSTGSTVSNITAVFNPKWANIRPGGSSTNISFERQYKDLSDIIQMDRNAQIVNNFSQDIQEFQSGNNPVMAVLTNNIKFTSELKIEVSYASASSSAGSAMQYTIGYTLD